MGESLVVGSARNTEQAETALIRAIDTARTQSAKFRELRASTSLARLWHSQGKTTEARDLLVPSTVGSPGGSIRLT